MIQGNGVHKIFQLLGPPIPLLQNFYGDLAAGRYIVQFQADGVEKQAAVPIDR
jgi:hypothetical protein